MATRSTTRAIVRADLLGDALHFLRMSDLSVVRCALRAPWGLALPPREDELRVHVVLSGRCWLLVDGAGPRALDRGDLVIVPHAGHRIASEPDAPAVAIDDLRSYATNDRFQVLGNAANGAPHVVCAEVRIDPLSRHLVSRLPRVLHVTAASTSHIEWIEATLRWIACEAATPSLPGAETVLARLAECVVVQVIRRWMQQEPAEQTGWLGALHDPQIGRAIALVHRDPARAWSVASLASEVGMSRSVFAARFTELVGEPAMHYVARWRMYFAMELLQADELALGEIATRMGYRSEASFSRAFKRCIGLPPGAARRRARTRDTLRSDWRDDMPGWFSTTCCCAGSHATSINERTLHACTHLDCERDPLARLDRELHRG